MTPERMINEWLAAHPGATVGEALEALFPDPEGPEGDWED